MPQTLDPAVATPGPGPALAPRPSPGRAPDDAAEAAVRELPRRLAAAWAAGDADAYAALFTADADYILFDGSRSQGRPAIADIHRPVFAVFLKGSRLAVELTALRFLTPTVALLHTRGGVLRRDETTPSKRQRSVQTVVAVETGGEWLIRAFQNTRYRPFTDTLTWKVLHALPFGPFRRR